MLLKDNRYIVLREFFNNPKESYGLRELSRAIKLAPPSVKRYIIELEKEQLIIKQEFKGNPVYTANRDNEQFKFLKKLDLIMQIKESGLLDYLSDRCMPDAIVLFGSGAKGEDIKGSDIDLFLLCKEQKLDLTTFDKGTKRTIGLFFADDFRKLSNELKNNLINGVMLHGYLKAF